MDTSVRTDDKWKTGEIIRNKNTGHPYLVTGVRKYICTYVIDLEDRSSPRFSLVLSKADYNDYVSDLAMEAKRTQDGSIEWSYNPLVL